MPDGDRCDDHDGPATACDCLREAAWLWEQMTEDMAVERMKGIE